MIVEHELTREARRLLRRLLGGARLQKIGEDGYVVSSRSGRRTRTRISASLASAVRSRGWLEEQEGELVATEAGKNWFTCGRSDRDFAAQHRLLATRLIKDENGREHYVIVNDAESPLAWMCRHRMITAVQFQAGERLRRDFTLAQLSPRLGVDWSLSAGRGTPGPGAPMTDAVLAAKQRFTHALRAAGPGLADLLFDVCCHLRKVQACERDRAWPRSSAKVVLRIALDRLGVHYGMIFRPSRRIRAWTMTEETE
jgi:Domain of unknown function (DUF6456)